MDLVIAIGVGSFVASLAAALVAILALRRQFPRRRLAFARSSLPLLVDNHADLQVKFRDHNLESPYLVTIWISSQSRADIPSSTFDAGKPIRFQLGRPVLGVMNSRAHRLEWSLHQSDIEIPPQLVHPDSRLRVDLLVDGEPDRIKIDNPLVDIKLVENEVLRSPSSTRGLTALVVAATGMAVVVGALFIVLVATGQI
jgi:hypothetical protein